MAFPVSCPPREHSLNSDAGDPLPNVHPPYGPSPLRHFATSPPTYRSSGAAGALVLVPLLAKRPPTASGRLIRLLPIRQESTPRRRVAGRMAAAGRGPPPPPATLTARRAAAARHARPATAAVATLLAVVLTGAARPAHKLAREWGAREEARANMPPASCVDVDGN